MSQLVTVDKPSDIELVWDCIQNAELIAFDIETTGVLKGSSIIGISLCSSEDKAFYIILQKWEGEKLISTGCESVTKDLLKALKDKKLIAHNGVFDCAMIEANYHIRLIDSLHTDTMILAHLLDENRRVGLKELAKIFFGEDSTKEMKEMKASIVANGGKVTKDEYELYKADAELIAKYGAQDALLTYKLFLELVPELFEQELDKFFYEDESMPLLKGPTYELNTIGLKLDQKELSTLKRTLEAECAEAKNFIYNEISSRFEKRYPGTNKKNLFNMKSNPQMAWLLFGEYGLEFGSLTDAGKEVCKGLNIDIPYRPAAKRTFINTCNQNLGRIYQPEAIVNGKVVKAKKVKEPWNYIKCDKDVLATLAPQYKWVERLMEYNKKIKILNTYVQGFEERVQYGVLYPSFLQHGTTSGRYASRNPNMQNIPRDDKRVKNCLISRPSKSFVGADFSQLEVRVFASVSQDPSLLAAFKTGEDFYSSIGMKVYGIYDATPHKEGSPDAFGIKYKKLRNQAKVIALASTYGASARQLAHDAGKSVEDMQEDINRYFEAFPKVAQMMEESHKMVKKQGYVMNSYGRPRRIPAAMKIEKIYGKEKHAKLPYEARNMLNLAVNHRIQSTAASICNRAMIKFYKDIRTAGIPQCHIVLQVHDEVVVECKDEHAEDVAILLQNAMETAVELQGMSLEAIPTIGKRLGDLK